MLRQLRKVFWVPTAILAVVGFTIFVVAAALLLLAWSCSFIAEDEDT